MTDIKNYLQDGANWQAQAVLAYIRANYDYILEHSTASEYGYRHADLYVGRYENCREQGYVFSIRYKGKCRNYAVYEHRNSDTLIVLISNCLTINTPSVDEMWSDHADENGYASKYDYDMGFKNGKIVDCGDYIIKDIRKFINDINNENNSK